MVGAPAAPDSLVREVAALRRMLVRRDGARALPDALAPLFDRLVAAGVDDTFAFRVLEGVDARAREGALARAVEDAFVAALPVPVAPATGDAARVFVGPAGAGKTATVSKLAVRAHLDGATTHVITLDGASLGARGHWEALSTLAGVPHTLALTGEAVRDAVAAQPAGATLLVDTPGIGAGQTDAIRALADLIAAAGPVDVHLVLPATTKPADARAAVLAFAPTRPSRLVFTRLDETATAGSSLEIAAAAGLSLAYVGTGRDIPDDIRAATPRDLVRRVLAGGFPA
jgi:flagellar biosynthesis protein FlhF